ncbi:MAG: UPF0104 family protein [Acidimicrobiales bacterium]|nr:UPF0104 family protein [Acidimicrobiales bacterium]
MLLGAVLGASGGRPPDPALSGFDLGFPSVRMAVVVGASTALFPYLARSVQRTVAVALALLALSTVASANGLIVAVGAGALLGWGMTAVVHLVFGSPVGLPSADEVTVLLVGDLELPATDVTANPTQRWGVARFTGRLEGRPIDVSLYGRDASDAQFLSKAARFLFYRDSGPTLALTRRQQVEHEAYLMLMAARAGARVPEVVAAGSAGPAHDAVLVSVPPGGDRLTGLLRDTAADADGAPVEGGSPAEADPAEGKPLLRHGPDDLVLDDLFVQVLRLRTARIAHGAISPETVVVDRSGAVGLVDFRLASTSAQSEQLDRDVAAALATAALSVGPVEAARTAARVVPLDALAAALPFVQKAALDTEAQRALRGQKAVLSAVRSEGAAAGGVDVPKLIEPRRISWVTLALVVGTLIGGWALIGVLVNVTKSWSTITGAKWGWVALVAILAQAAYPAIAITTVGSVTNPLAFGRTWALEVANTFVALAGGSMAVLATRVRFFQQEGYDATLAVSSGVLVSTASWIVKGGLFLVCLPFALGQLHFTKSPSGESGSHSGLVWIILLAVIGAGVLLGAVFAVPRWRRMAAEKIRPKASEVWSHLRVLSTHPRNLVEIFGGNLAAQLLVAMALGASLHAFGQHLGLATIVVVLTLGSMLGGVSPVPGGMGVVEAGMIFGLVAAGIQESVAVAAVFVQRLFTAYLPPIWGWFTLVWMRKREYL